MTPRGLSRALQKGGTKSLRKFFKQLTDPLGTEQ
jgi:hypothetical protein